jgi:hypothetical protein
MGGLSTKTAHSEETKPHDATTEHRNEPEAILSELQWRNNTGKGMLCGG